MTDWKWDGRAAAEADSGTLSLGWTRIDRPLPVRRVPVRIAIHGASIAALANDGTIWNANRYEGGWRLMPPLPQYELVEKPGDLEAK